MNAERLAPPIVDANKMIIEGDSDLFAHAHDYEVLEPEPFKGILDGVKHFPGEKGAEHDKPRE